jgi:GDPmannose 4,6-dehydratase
VARSWQEPIGTAEITGLAVARLLDAAGRAAARGSAPRVLVASSAEIFGEPDDVPQSEHTPMRPTSPYGVAKAYAQMLVRMYRHVGLPLSSVILFNHESPRRPEHFVTLKISRTVAAIQRGVADELVLGNIDVRRDWGGAPDYVDAMVLAKRHPVPDDPMIATGISHSIRDFVHAAFVRGHRRLGAPRPHRLGSRAPDRRRRAARRSDEGPGGPRLDADRRFTELVSRIVRAEQTALGMQCPRKSPGKAG